MYYDVTAKKCLQPTDVLLAKVSNDMFCFSVQRKLERDWVLSVLEEGVRDKHCYEICENQGIYQTLLGFSSTPLCDQASQVLLEHLTQNLLLFLFKCGASEQSNIIEVKLNSDLLPLYSNVLFPGLNRMHMRSLTTCRMQ